LVVLEEQWTGGKGSSGQPAFDLETLRERLSRDAETTPIAARYAHWQIESAFQPVFSVAHGLLVGHEALIRTRAEDGVSVPPATVLRYPTSPMEQLYLDRLSRTVHFENFLRQSPTPQWLFINVHPDVFPLSPTVGTFFADLLRSARLPRHSVVVEILEDAASNPTAMELATGFYRDLGCLLALDDFGAGHSNFDRVWALRPDLVKLDRTMVLRATREPRVRRALGRLVGLLHDASARVLMEGIESGDQLAMALDCNVDFVQGFFLGRPEPTLAATECALPLFEAIWRRSHLRARADAAATEERLAPYRAAVDAALPALASGVPLETACARFLDLPEVYGCFLLDADGEQLGPIAVAHGPVGAQDARRFPMQHMTRANRAYRPYFRTAIAAPGVLHASQPYLSADGGRPCVTLSIAIERDGRQLVVCAHIAWPERTGSNAG
jgi:EAL domain-containing protein (putative c-di-GMP-specific phosphodiesterase class I)